MALFSFMVFWFFIQSKFFFSCLSCIDFFVGGKSSLYLFVIFTEYLLVLSLRNDVSGICFFISQFSSCTFGISKYNTVCEFLGGLMTNLIQFVLRLRRKITFVNLCGWHIRKVVILFEIVIFKLFRLNI